MLGRLTLINKIVAANLSLSEKEVESVNTFFFKELESEMTECNHPFIFVRGLGTFAINKRLLEKRIRFLLECIRLNRQEEREGKKNTKREIYIAGMRREIYFLLGVRRMIKRRWNENNRKNKANYKGQLLQDSGKE